MRAGTCEACHGMDMDFWAKMKEEKEIKAAPNDEMHTLGIRRIMKSGVK